MQSFRTALANSNWDFQIDYPSSHLLIGSCFSENVGERLSQSKFNCCLNPFGIIYHPLVISRLMQRLLEGKKYKEEDLVHFKDHYISFDHHGQFNNPDANVSIERINQAFDQGVEFLNQGDFIYLTWGSAYGYEHSNFKDAMVANCHKIASTEFSRIKSTPSEIVEEYDALLKQIHSINPNAKVILTVSPVKHLRDGLIENNRSKAVLVLAAEELSSRFDFVHYFPAFELVQDDLRDYRFYDKDMAHPSEEAIEYIWNYFLENLVSKSAKKILKRIKTIQQATEHRPLHPEHSSYPIFLKKTLDKMRILENEYSFLDYDIEKRRLEEKLTTNL